MAGDDPNANNRNSAAGAAGATSSGSVKDMNDDLKRHVASKLVRMTSQLQGHADSSSEEETGDPLLGAGGSKEDQLKKELAELDDELTARTNVSYS